MTGYLFFEGNPDQGNMYAKVVGIERLPALPADHNVTAQEWGPVLLPAEPSDLNANIYAIPSNHAPKHELLYTRWPYLQADTVYQATRHDANSLRDYPTNREVAQSLAQLAIATQLETLGTPVIVTPTPDARGLLNVVLSTRVLQWLSSAPHREWLEGKERDRLDPDNPYEGYGPERIRVRDLTPEELQARGIPDDYNPNADITHPLHIPPEELDENAKSKNMGPVAVLAATLGDVILPQGATVDNLKDILRTIESGYDPDMERVLSTAQHTAYLVSELRAGARPFGPNPHPDFKLFEDLSLAVQALDLTTIRPVARELAKLLDTEASRAYMEGLLAGQALAPAVHQATGQ